MSERGRAQPAQHRIAEILVEPRHRIGHDASTKAVTHHEIRTSPELHQKLVNSAEVVTVVGITHHHEFAVCGADTAVQGGAVATFRYMDEACAFTGGNSL